MDGRELEVGLQMLVEQMEDEAIDGHELLMHLTQTLNQMRGLNMPVPADLLALEQQLATEYTVPPEGTVAAAAIAARRRLAPATPLRTKASDLLGCDYPILLAGMGGVARAELAAAVSGAGGYGYLGMVRETPETITREIAAVRALTDRPFGVNLIPYGTDPALLEAELAACFAAKVHSLCFFWEVQPELVRRAHDAGCLVAWQVGTMAAGEAAQEAGADLVICQGVEAGGHVHGTVTSLVLLPQMASMLSIPVIGSGGFGSGAGLVAALALGAQGIHCGTAFLATEESFAHDYHKQRIIDAASTDTVYSDVFAINWPPRSPVRTLHNSVTAAWRDDLLGHGPDDFEREAIAEEEGRPVYRYSTESPLRNMTGDFEPLAPYAGQVCGLVEGVRPAAEVVKAMVSEAEVVLAGLAGK
jgi:nitronate monooxygenase